MLYEVVKHYEVEAPNEETAKQIIQSLEEKNQQGLFLRWVYEIVVGKPGKKEYPHR